MESCTTCGSKISKSKRENYKQNLDNLTTILAYVKILKKDLIDTKFENFKLRKTLSDLARVELDLEKSNKEIKEKFQEAFKKSKMPKFNYFAPEKRVRYRIKNSKGKWIRLNFGFKFDLCLIKDQIEKLVKFLKDYVETECYLRVNLLEKGKTYYVSYDGIEFRI